MSRRTRRRASTRTATDRHEGRRHDDLSASRPEYLFVIRESGRSLPALKNMLDQTLIPFLPVPGVQEALAAGVEPFLHPEAWGATRVARSGTRGVIYARSGSWFLIIEGSAAMEDPYNQARWKRSENVYVEILSDQLVELRPRKLVAATFSRLVRSDEFAADLFKVVKRHVEEVHCSDLQVFEPATESGRRIWNMATEFATMERAAIIRRLSTGILAAAAQGIWPLGKRNLPFGYTLTKDKRVVPDPSRREVLSSAIDILATPNLTALETVHLLAAAGVTSSRLRERIDSDDMDGDDAGDGSVHALRNPSGYIRTLVDWIDTYRTGKYLYQRKNGLPGEKQLGGFVVLGADEDGIGYLEVEMDLGLPEGGWAAPEALDAAETNWNTPRRRGGQQGVEVRPLTNVVAWQADGSMFKLIARGRDLYYLCRKDTPDGMEFVPGKHSPYGAGWVTAGRLDGECIASIRASELHASIVDGVLALMRDGVELERLDGWATLQTMGSARLVDVRSNRLAILDREIEEAQARSRGTRRLAAVVAKDLTDDADFEQGLGKQMSADIRAAEAEVHRLQCQRERLARETPEPVNFGKGFHGEVAFLARALANLANSRGSAPRELARSLAEILMDFRMEADQVEVRWSCQIVFSAEKSAVQFQVRGSVPNRLKPMGTNSPKFGLELVGRVLWDGVPLSELSAFYGLREMPQSWRRRMQEALVTLGLNDAAARVMFSAPPDVGRVVYGHLLGLDLPSGIDPDWAALVVRAYTNPLLTWRKGWYFHMPSRQSHLDALARLGGEASFDQLRAHVPVSMIYRISEPVSDPARDKAAPATMVRIGHWERRGKGAAVQRVALIACPHGDCEGRCTKVVWTPDTAWGLNAPASVICPRCRRLPVPGSPQFPEFYLHLDEPWTDVCGRAHHYGDSWGGTSGGGPAVAGT